MYKKNVYYFHLQNNMLQTHQYRRKTLGSFSLNKTCTLQYTNDEIRIRLIIVYKDKAKVFIYEYTQSLLTI